MPNKSRQDLEVKLTIKEELETERERSDRRYAFKIYERAIIGLVTLIVSAVLLGILKTTLSL